MKDIAVDRAGRPMYDAAGRKLSIAERNSAYRIATVEIELKTANAAHHYVLLERDKLRVENTELRELCDKADEIMARMAEEAREDDTIRTLAQAVVDIEFDDILDEGHDNAVRALAKGLSDG
jgi:hypothetical protein